MRRRNCRLIAGHQHDAFYIVRSLDQRMKAASQGGRHPFAPVVVVNDDRTFEIAAGDYGRMIRPENHNDG